jgi:hypothetical protein
MYASFISTGAMFRTNEREHSSIAMNESASNSFERAADLAIREKLDPKMARDAAVKSFEAATKSADFALEFGMLKTAQKMYTRSLDLSMKYGLDKEFSDRADANMLKVAFEIQKSPKNPIEQQLRTESA